MTRADVQPLRNLHISEGTYANTTIVMTALLIGIILAMLPLSAWAQESFTTSLATDSVALPLTYRNNASPVVEVMLNGKGPFRFVFETGAGGGQARLDERVFNALNLPVVDSVVAHDGSGINARHYPVTSIAHLSLGSYTILEAKAMTRAYSQRGGQMDGAIGLPFFKGVLVQLNFAQNELIIWKGKLDKNDPQVIPFKMRDGIPIITAELNGKHIEVILDTGNMGGLTFRSAEIDAKLIHGEPRVVGQAKTVSNTFEIKEATLNVPIRFGNLQFDHPLINLNDLLPANMGVRFSRQLNITFDVTQQLLKLEKIAVPGVAEQAERSSLPASDFAGEYGNDRTITIGNDNGLYLTRRPNGQALKMLPKSTDQFGLEIVPEAVLVFERDAGGRIRSMKVSRDKGTTWEVFQKK